MSRRRRLMSDELRRDLARELGVYELAARRGFGAVSSEDNGNLVKLAIERAERQLQQTDRQ